MRGSQPSRKSLWPSRFAAAAAVLIIASGAADAWAQARTDKFRYQGADAHAACDSKTLPRAGFRILQVVPGTNGKECYWVRDTRNEPDGLADTQDGGRPQAAMQRDLQAARERYQSTLRAIDEQRAASWRRFMGKLLTCGPDFDCQMAAVERRIANDRNLDAAASRAASQLNVDVDQILQRYQATRRGEPPRGRVARPQ